LRIGGNGVNSVSIICWETFDQSSYACFHRSPSPGANCSIDAIVVSRSRLIVAARPSGSRWVSTSGELVQLRSSSRLRSTGEEYPRG